MCSSGGGWEKYLYNDIVCITACGAGLGSGRPEVKPSTSEPLPVRLRELTGKLGWMNWEPVSLAEDAPLSEVRRSQDAQLLQFFNENIHCSLAFFLRSTACDYEAS